MDKKKKGEKMREEFFFENFSIDRHLSENSFPLWLEKIKKTAFKKFEDDSFLLQKAEDKKYSRLELLKTKKNLFKKKTKTKIFFESKKAGNSVFTSIKNALNENKKELKVCLREFLEKANDKLSLFNLAFFSNGVFLLADSQKSFFKSKIIVQNSVKPFLSVVYAKKDSDYSYIEEGASTGTGYSGFSSSFKGEENSFSRFYSLEKHGTNKTSVSKKIFLLSKNAFLENHSLVFPGKFSKTVNDSFFLGKGSNAKTFSCFLGKKDSFMDLKTNSFHLVENTSNDIQEKGVLTGNAGAVFRGLIKIYKDAQQTNSYLSSNTLLLGKKSIANSIPELQIDANNVKASHGATITYLDESQLFYLQSRGLTKEQAEKLIVKGFYFPLLNKITNRNARELFTAKWIKNV